MTVFSSGWVYRQQTAAAGRQRCEVDHPQFSQEFSDGAGSGESSVSAAAVLFPAAFPLEFRLQSVPHTHRFLSYFTLQGTLLLLPVTLTSHTLSQTRVIPAAAVCP